MSNNTVKTARDGDDLPIFDAVPLLGAVKVEAKDTSANVLVAIANNMRVVVEISCSTPCYWKFGNDTVVADRTAGSNSPRLGADVHKRKTMEPGETHIACQKEASATNGEMTIEICSVETLRS